MYIFVCVDDFSHFWLVAFLREKSKAFESFKTMCIRLKKEKDESINKILMLRSDHGREFKNAAD